MSLSTASNKSSTVELKNEKTLKPQLSVLYSSGLRTAASYQDLKSTKSVAALSVLTRPVERLMIPGVLLTLETNCRASLMEKTPLINGRKSAFLILGPDFGNFWTFKRLRISDIHFSSSPGRIRVLGSFWRWVRALSDMYIWLSLIQWHFSRSERERERLHCARKTV